MNDRRKYKGGLLALGAGMVLDSPIFSLLGLWLLYKAGDDSDEPERGEIPGARRRLAAWEVAYNRAILTLCAGVGIALLLSSPPAALAVASTSTALGCWMIRRAGQLERQTDLASAAKTFMHYVEANKLGYTVSPASNASFEIRPLWTTQVFAVSVHAGTGKAGQPASEGAAIAVRWHPNAARERTLRDGSALIVNGGPALLDASIKIKLSEVLKL